MKPRGASTPRGFDPNAVVLALLPPKSQPPAIVDTMPSLEESKTVIEIPQVTEKIKEQIPIPQQASAPLVIEGSDEDIENELEEFLSQEKPVAAEEIIQASSPFDFNQHPLPSTSTKGTEDSTEANNLSQSNRVNTNASPSPQQQEEQKNDGVSKKKRSQKQAAKETL